MLLLSATTHDPPQLRPPRLHVRFQALPNPSSTSQVRVLAVRWNEHHQVPPVWRVPPCCAVEVEAGFVNSPTQRSLALLRDRGCAVAILEHWNSFTNRRQDAFGFIDLWAVLPTGESFYIQTTTQAGIAARRDKIREIVSKSEPLTALVKAGRVVLHGWAKRSGGVRGGRKLWTCVEEIVTL